jgi:protein-S-isoprenylcysteine O-methyltransferase Ste14
MTENVTGVKVPPPALYLVGFLAGYLVQRWRPLPWPHGMANDLVGAALVIVGTGLVLDFLQRFRRAGTTVNPTVAASTLITDGAYGFSRNPGYLGWTLASAGIAMLLYWTWCLVLLPLVVLLIDRLVIVREERFLEERFGNEYRAYKQRVRRWI